MNLITALEIYNNYPDQITITSAKDEKGNFGGFAYRLKGDAIHKMLFTTTFTFSSASEAEEYLHSVCREACVYVKNQTNIK
jgi:hypothetical protein